ncbi:MAG: sulfite reductase subunit alpha [Rubritepida sp.]|nr:sulfite reductase subunit alpha [Rubritepida sp.]
MNAMNPPLPLIPDNAPFTPAQRAWLNGFLAGLYGGASAGMSTAPPPPLSEDFPWHDPALNLDERVALAEGRALPRRLMAAMAQLDCGQCGYLCESYAEALAEGRETSTSLCVPGAKATTRAIKAMMADAPSPIAPASPAAPAAKLAIARVAIRAATCLTGPGSDKDVRHMVIDLADSGLIWLPGDSIALTVPNDPALVAALLTRLGLTGDEKVPCADGTERQAREAFTHHLAIARPMDRTTDLLAMAATHLGEAAALRRLTDGEDGAEPDAADLLDLLEAFPSARPVLADLCRSLPRLQPRLYSIASSPRGVSGEVHLCIGVVAQTRRGRLRHGVASGFLAHRASAAGPVEARIQPSHFRLPADPATPVIMVGPGTGIAPFRAFLQDRAAIGTRGRAWLFFGDRRRNSDFLYEDDLMGWLADGTLSRLDTAFSRDGAGKIYVQDRMRENAADLWRWLQDGAHFYVCGDATRMARDVDAALRAVAMDQGGLDAQQARNWIVALARQGRYLRDVY